MESAESRQRKRTEARALFRALGTSPVPNANHCTPAAYSLQSPDSDADCLSNCLLGFKVLSQTSCPLSSRPRGRPQHFSSCSYAPEQLWPSQPLYRMRCGELRDAARRSVGRSHLDRMPIEPAGCVTSESWQAENEDGLCGSRSIPIPLPRKFAEGRKRPRRTWSQK